MRRALHAEWTKLRTAGGAGWLLLAAVLATAGGSAASSAAADCSALDCGQDPVRVALFGVQLGQAAIALLGVLAIGEEYGTGLIRATLLATPRRATVLAAKAVLLTGLALAAGALGVLASVPAGHLLLPDGLALPPLTDERFLRAIAGSVLYLAFVALLGLGTATTLRDSTTAAGAVLGLLYLLPLLSAMLHDPDWQRLLWRLSPANAGQALQATASALPLSPAAGLGVISAWAAAALLSGLLVLRSRDA